MRQVQHSKWYSLALAALVFAAMTLSSTATARQGNAALVTEVIGKLNSHASVAGAESAKAYKTLFDAYLDLGKPPMPIGPAFNLNTIHPKMADWSKVTGWAESNPKMADAIIECKKSGKFTKIGLPYGRDSLDPKYVRAGITADVGVNGSLRENAFPYFGAMDTIAAFATAEAYRLMEANQAQRALDLYVSLAFIVRVFGDREFLAEKLHFIDMLSDVMENTRDLFYTYQDRITAEQYSSVAQKELPFLRPDRSRLFMPEADRTVAEALIREVFDEGTGQAKVEPFAATFAEVQSKDAPMTRFGAAKRWEMIASIHSSLKDSLDRLNLIYDDWWRRWRIDQYDSQLLAVRSQFDRTNRIRYAAVLYSIEDLSNAFAVRNTLVAEVNGTAVAAGLCAYKKTYGVYPDDKEKIYGQSLRKASDSDPFDKELKPFKYRQISARHRITHEAREVWVDSGESLLYSVGVDHEDSRGAEASIDGSKGDMVIWPPLKAIARAQGVIE